MIIIYKQLIYKWKRNNILKLIRVKNLSYCKYQNITNLQSETKLMYDK